MKTRYLILLAFALLGCSSTTPCAISLTADQAGALAQKLANEKARALFNCQPFRNGPPAQFVQGHWAWHALQGQGIGDVEATVEFAASGANPHVSVTRLADKSMVR